MVDNRLDTVFHALADPTRRGMLARLALGETSVGELAEPVPMSLAGASKHVKVLEQAGPRRAAQGTGARILQPAGRSRSRKPSDGSGNGRNSGPSGSTGSRRQSNATSKEKKND